MCVSNQLFYRKRIERSCLHGDLMAAPWHRHLTKAAPAQKVKLAKKQKKEAMTAKTIPRRRSRMGKDVHCALVIK